MTIRPPPNAIDRRNGLLRIQKMWSLLHTIDLLYDTEMLLILPPPGVSVLKLVRPGLWRVA
jgi:hypothetical protein